MNESQRVTIQDFIIFAQQGREIEFSFAGRSLFLSPMYDSKHQYCLWDNGLNMSIAEGSIQQILECDIGDSCMNDCWDKVNIEYIL